MHRFAQLPSKSSGGLRADELRRRSAAAGRAQRLLDGAGKGVELRRSFGELAAVPVGELLQGLQARRAGRVLVRGPGDLPELRRAPDVQ
jgi:hypothetical protein